MSYLDIGSVTFIEALKALGKVRLLTFSNALKCWKKLVSDNEKCVFPGLFKTIGKVSLRQRKCDLSRCLEHEESQTKTIRNVTFPDSLKC